MKFIDTQRFSPIIYENDVPHERDMYWHNPLTIPTSKKEYQAFLKRENIIIDRHWWERQKKRCIEGYFVDEAIDYDSGEIFIEGVNTFRKGDTVEIPHLGITIKNKRVWISGKHYFYLNFWVIQREERALERKIVGNPFFTDLSFENWWIRQRMRSERKDNMLAKARQKGASEEEACDTSWDFCFLQDVQLAIVGGLSDYNERTFLMVKRGLANLYNTQFYKEFSVNTSDFIMSKYTNARLYSRTAKGNAQILSGLTPYHVKLEEIGIMEKGLVKDIADFVKPSLYVGGRKVGYITYIGTGGEADEGVEDMEKMFYNPSEYNLLEFENIYEDEALERTAYFMPAWKFEKIDDQGNSLKEESNEYLDDEMNKLDPKGKFQFNILKPRKPSDIFNIITGGFFGDQIAQWCSETRAYINNHRKARIVERGDLKWKNRRKPWMGVEWIPNNDAGVFYIAEHPILTDKGVAKEGIYYAGTDSYDQDEAKTSKSKLAGLIYKTYDSSIPYEDTKIFNNFVAYYLDRPSVEQGGASVAYENSAKLCVYYSAMNMIEYSKILIFSWYEDNAMETYLKPRPDMAIANMVEKSNVSNRWGFHGSLVIHGLKMLRDWCNEEENIRRCPFPELLLAWSRFKIHKDYNCDITIAAMLCVVSAENDLMYLKYEEEEDHLHTRSFKGYKTVNGRLQEVYT